MTSALFSWRPPVPFESHINRWFDSERSGRALWVFLGLFVSIWTSFQIISYASTNLSSDLVEAFAWSRHLALGYKHPPLTAIIVRAWFSVFPVADWSFHLLAMVNAAVALFAVDCIARRYLDGDKRLLVLLLLLLTPFYQFHGQRFSTNQVLLSTWPIATYCFLRSFESRTLLWSFAAGATAALAMLGKYYSGFLIVGFVAAALAHPKRLDYLRSPAPWLSVLVGSAILAPHVYWLLSAHAPTIAYIFDAHGTDPMSKVIWKTVLYLIESIGYVALPILVYLAAVRPSLRTLAEAAWPSDPDRRMLVVLLAVPLLLPMLASPILHVTLTPLWCMQGWFLLPIVLLSPADVVLARRDAIRVASLVLCIALVTLLASPAVAWNRFHAESEKHYRGHHAAVSQELTRQWRLAMQRPLTIVTGEFTIACALTFYSPDHPEAWILATPTITPWITQERRQREGWGAVCPAEDRFCLARLERSIGDARGVIRSEYEHSASFLWMRNQPVRFTVMVVPPQQDQ